MLKKYVLTFCFMLLAAGMIFPFVRIGKAQLARVYIDPAQITGLAIGDSFTVSVKVADVTDLGGWEFQLFYDARVLNATANEEGSFLKSVQNTFYIPYKMDDNYNATYGIVYLACTTMPVTGASGSGTLASVTFKIVGAGCSVLAIPLETTKLLDSTPAKPQPIPHTTENGLVCVTGADIAITGIYLSKTIVSATQVTINVTAANLGNFTGSFNVTLYYNTTEIATKPVTNLAPSTSLNLTFTWDTTPIPKGNYTMSAYAPPIAGENNAANNRLTDGWIKVTILGDVNGDGSVDILDISILARAFLTKPGDPKWNPNGDLDNSGEINIVDITKAAKEFGKKDP